MTPCLHVRQRQLGGYVQLWTTIMRASIVCDNVTQEVCGWHCDNDSMHQACIDGTGISYMYTPTVD